MRMSLCVDPGRSWPQVLALAEQALAQIDTLTHAVLPGLTR